MSHILVTGADGFVGRALVRRLLAQADHTLTLIDHSFDSGPAAGNVRHLKGSFCEPAMIDLALEQPADIVFHLASVPGALAERDYELGRQVNLHATLSLAHRLADQGRMTGSAPRFVFASSVAVYGRLGQETVREDQIPQPALSYGAHKWMTEIALANLSRRGEIDAVSLRLPGIVARPAGESGHGSAFMSLVMHKLAAGQPYVCPVSAHATGWWMSLPCCVDNLLHAARMSTAAAPPSRTWQLPVLHLGMEQIVAALAKRYGPRCHDLVSFAPDERIEALFGRYPALHTPTALAAGFRHDDNADLLIEKALS
jgi:nucleoside-diphosphate-sugar epimerase